MAVHGQLSAAKLGDRWFVERAAVERRRRDGAFGGRRFSSRNAWALLSLASGEEVEGIDPSARSRLKRALRQEGLTRLGPRLARRAEALSLRAHPGEIPHLLADPRLSRSGVSATANQGFDLIPGREADGYVREDELDSFVVDHVLEPVGIAGNVRLRVVPRDAHRFLVGKAMAPRAAVALDLSENFDPRSAEAGRNALREFDCLWRDG
jgi:hypothetical protein